MKIGKGEYLVTAWAEYCSGPGWSNQLINVIIKDINGKMRQDCLQPAEQSKSIRDMFEIHAVCNKKLMHQILEK